MIKIINPDMFLRENTCKGPILSTQYYFGNSTSFHPQGLYSEDIFGVEGSPERKSSFSWIDLNCDIIHPLLYDILTKRIFKKINLLLSGEKLFSLDENGHLVENEEGEIRGITGLKKVIHKVRFSEGEDEDGDRNKIISNIYNNIDGGTFFMNKLIIISPEYRPPYVSPETEETRIDELTKLYQKILSSSNQLHSVSGSLFDILAYRMQLMIRELYELIKVKIGKKSGLIRENILGKRNDYTARTVITPNPTLPIGYCGVPLRIALQIFEPNIIYGILNSPYAKNISHDFVLATKDYIAKESFAAE